MDFRTKETAVISVGLSWFVCDIIICSYFWRAANLVWKAEIITSCTTSTASDKASCWSDEVALLHHLGKPTMAYTAYSFKKPRKQASGKEITCTQTLTINNNKQEVCLLHYAEPGRNHYSSACVLSLYFRLQEVLSNSQKTTGMKVDERVSDFIRNLKYKCWKPESSNEDHKADQTHSKINEKKKVLDIYIT